MVNLRARYYAPFQGRFIGRDTWSGNLTLPMSFNRWLYVYGSPINLTDPSGYDPWWCDYLSEDEEDIIRCRLEYFDALMNIYGRANDSSGTLIPPPGCTSTPSSDPSLSPTQTTICPNRPGYHWEIVEANKFRLSSYYRPRESQWSKSDPKVKVNLDGNLRGFNKSFAISSYGVPMQGSGIARDGTKVCMDLRKTKYLEWDQNYEWVTTDPKDIYFSTKCVDPAGGLQPFRTAAIHQDLESKLKGETICLYSPLLINSVRSMSGMNNHDGVIRINDTCSGCGMTTNPRYGTTYGIDLYVGEGSSAATIVGNWWNEIDPIIRVGFNILKSVPGDYRNIIR